MHDLSVRFFKSGLASHRHCLEQASKHAEARGVPPENLLNARLIADMRDLKSQTQMLCDTARKGAARLAGAEPEVWPDEETTLPELFDRIDRTVAYLDGLDEAAFEDAATREFTVEQFHVTGREYLVGFAIPNFVFHVTTAYDILRANGVELGKRDFIAAFMRG